MRVLVTGGAGYIGAALSERLSGQEEVSEIVIYDNLSRGNYNLFMGGLQNREKLRFIEGDVLDSRNLRKAVREADIVYHLAAKVTTPFADQNAHLFEQVNHWGTAEVCYAVEESEVEKLIFLSSVSVYGSGGDVKDVSAPLNPRTFYGISKMRGEEHVLRLEDKKDVRILRCGNVYGYHPSMRFDAVINKFMFEANFKRKINIHGDGQQHRAFVYIDTVVDELLRELSSAEPPSVRNVVEHNLRVIDIAEILQQLVPDMEMIFINHNMKLRELRIGEALTDEDQKALLKKRLQLFQEKLAF